MYGILAKIYNIHFYLFVILLLAFNLKPVTEGCTFYDINMIACHLLAAQT